MACGKQVHRSSAGALFLFVHVIQPIVMTRSPSYKHVLPRMGELLKDAEVCGWGIQNWADKPMCNPVSPYPSLEERGVRPVCSGPVHDG